MYTYSEWFDDEDKLTARCMELDKNSQISRYEVRDIYLSDGTHAGTYELKVTKKG